MKAGTVAALFGVLVASAAVPAARECCAAAAVDWSHAQRIDMRITEYKFIPNALRLRHAVPYRLHLINVGKEGHDFSAADFFAAAQVRNPEVLNDGKSVYLAPNESADIYFIAPAAGLFAPRCADHDWAGMTATIIVE